MIIAIEDYDIPIELKQAKAEPIVALQNKYRDIMKLLRAAGAQEPEDE